ncbi:MAG: ABC transporter ATP-binding protein [Acidimicrobiales bacterium]
MTDLEVVYSAAVLGLRGADLSVAQGSIVALLGANGAGKTTLLRAITGLLGFHEARITRGEIELRGTVINNHNAAQIVARGVSQAMEGRRIFGALSIEENLKVGGVSVKDRTAKREIRDRVFELFPVLGERRRQQAGYLSGGEQQMLAIGRALMAQPDLLLLDEPSLGLAPLIVTQIRDVIVDINRAGTTVLLVEQNAAMALSIADHGFVLENGRVGLSGSAAELRDNEDMRALYLGGSIGSEVGS